MSYHKINPAPHTTWQYTPMAIRYDEAALKRARFMHAKRRVARWVRKHGMGNIPLAARHIREMGTA